MTRPRATAVAALLITAAGALYAAIVASTQWEPSLGWLVQAVIHVGELLAALALGLTVANRVARGGLAAAVVGQALLAIAEVVYPGSPGLGDVLFGIGPMLTGVGLIVAGSVLVRGPDRTVWPLILGLYVFVVMTPVLIGTGGPPAPAAVWTIAGWDVLWALVAAVAVRRFTPAEAGPNREAAVVSARRPPR
ncbi:hypothetical protein [Cryptosporangium phraense]|uniref:DUF4386 family protein n=1 Tax=Cryptosporangium phraense TaxID=2593070 RepID=A0A545AYW4_9ACTN|nr:hypothetical protein [Cryptosporangium phraense]TQS46522.1 hypothetical protein FL583_03825 [Cryptosporangium phraense]